MCGRIKNVHECLTEFKYEISSEYVRLFESQKCDDKMLAAPNPVTFTQRKTFLLEDTVEFTQDNKSREVC